MVTNNIYANISEIDKFSNDIRNKTMSMNSILDDLITMTMDMDRFFDTPSGKIMKDSLIDYLKESKLKCSSLDYICEGLDSSKRMYEMALSNSKNSVRG